MFPVNVQQHPKTCARTALHILPYAVLYVQDCLAFPMSVSATNDLLKFSKLKTLTLRSDATFSPGPESSSSHKQTVLVRISEFCQNTVGLV